MTNDIDIHQLDPERQVLFILNESRTCLSVPQIKKKLLECRISPDTSDIKKLLDNQIRKSDRGLQKNGMIHKSKNSYTIMDKGEKYLNSTIMIIDSSSAENIQDTIDHFLSGLVGEIKICDPYFDDTASDLLNRCLTVRKSTSIKIIYGIKNRRLNKKCKIAGILPEFKEVSGDIHDRFIIDQNHAYLLGTSLNSIGKKLSFIVNLTVYKEIFENIFNLKWNNKPIGKS